MHAGAGINASDVNASAGRYTPGAKPPFGIGFEAVGVVQASGSEASSAGFAVGQAVAVQKLGCFAEHVVVEIGRDMCFRIDAPLPSVVPLLIGGLTSSIGLEVAGEMKSADGAPKTVLVTGASGGTGIFAVQLAALAGHHVVGTCSSADKMATLRALGCKRPVNYKTENLEEVLKQEFPRGVDLVFEGVGGKMLEIAKRCGTSSTAQYRLVPLVAHRARELHVFTCECFLPRRKGATQLHGPVVSHVTCHMPLHGPACHMSLMCWQWSRPMAGLL